MKRKDFIIHSAIVSSGLLVGCKSTSGIGKTLQASINFDLHAHPGIFIQRGTPDYIGDQAFNSRIADMYAAGINGVFFSLVTDLPLLKITPQGVVPNGQFNKDEGWIEFERQLFHLDELLKGQPAQITSNADDLNNTGKTQVYLSCEGGDFLGGDINLVDRAYEKGVRSIQLVHYAPNALGDLQTWKSEHNGLSVFGRQVVSRMNKLGMLIDVAHASMKTVKDVVDLSKAPVMLSHSVLNTDPGRPISARAISKEHALMVSRNGGLIGMWPSGYSSSFDDFVEHTLRMIDVVGVEHVGMGTDMDANFQPVITDYQGFNNWKKALLDKGLSREDVNLLAGENARRVLKKVI